MAISKYSSTTTSVTVYCSYPSGTTITRTKMYRNGTYVGDGSASNSFYYTFGGLSPSTTYQFTVQWFTTGETLLGSNSGNYSTNDPPDTTGPSISINITNVQYDRFTVSYNASDPSGIDIISFYLNNNFYTSFQSPSGSFVISGLTYNTNYTVTAYAWDNLGNQSYDTDSVRTPFPPRPNNFSWSTAKIQGQSFNLTAQEWTNLQNRINDFRWHKGLNQYSFYNTYNGLGSFTRAVSGNVFYYYHFNQARSAINAMSPSVTVPPSVSSKDVITASMLNRLRDSLNSI